MTAPDPSPEAGRQGGPAERYVALTQMILMELDVERALVKRLDAELAHVREHFTAERERSHRLANEVQRLRGEVGGACQCGRHRRQERTG